MPVVVAGPLMSREPTQIEFKSWSQAWNYALELAYELVERGYSVMADRETYFISAIPSTPELPLLERARNAHIITVNSDEPEMDMRILCDRCGKELRGGPLEHLTPEDRAACP